MNTKKFREIKCLMSNSKSNKMNYQKEDNKKVTSIGDLNKMQCCTGDQRKSKRATYIKDSVPRKTNSKGKLRFWGREKEIEML